MATLSSSPRTDVTNENQCVHKVSTVASSPRKTGARDCSPTETSYLHQLTHLLHVQIVTAKMPPCPLLYNKYAGPPSCWCIFIRTHSPQVQAYRCTSLCACPFSITLVRFPGLSFVTINLIDKVVRMTRNIKKGCIGGILSTKLTLLKTKSYRLMGS